MGQGTGAYNRYFGRLNTGNGDPRGDGSQGEVDPERTASKFDAAYYRRLLDKALGEAAFVFRINQKDSEIFQGSLLPYQHAL